MPTVSSTPATRPATTAGAASGSPAAGPILIVRSNGLMLPTLEVEAMLVAHPAVKDVVIIGYQDPAVPGADLACAVVVPEARRPRWPS